MKLTIMNNGQDAVEVRYTRKDGSERVALINPGKANLPADAKVVSSHPNVRVFDAQGNPQTISTPVAVQAQVQAIPVTATAPTQPVLEPAVEVTVADNKGARK